MKEIELKQGFVYYPKARRNLKIKYLGISAHEDDLEIMAFDGIKKGYRQDGGSFAAVVSTDGAGSARTGRYADYTDDMMKKVRVKEQEAAAERGCYETLYMLNYSSKEVKDPANQGPIADYAKIIKELHPEVIYTHNPADKHPTHLAVVCKVILAIRTLKKEDRPSKLYGCDVWRDLDWLNDESKVEFDLSGEDDLAKDLLICFDSQIVGGKRYDLATIGRRYANATYAQSHAVDGANAVGYAIDLTPLIQDDKLDIIEFIEGYISSFGLDVKAKLGAALGK